VLSGYGGQEGQEGEGEKETPTWESRFLIHPPSCPTNDQDSSLTGSSRRENLQKKGTKEGEEFLGPLQDLEKIPRD